MQFNKWLKVGLDALTALSGAAAAFDWSSVVSSHTAASIAAGIATLRVVMGVVAPSPGTTVTTPKALVKSSI